MSSPQIIQVANELQLNQAIATVDGATSGSYVIQFTADITEGTDTGGAITFNGTTLSAPADLYALNLQSGVTLTIDGQGHMLSGADTYRGFFAYAGAVTIQSLAIDNTVAQGGNGGAARYYAGGAGAGLGGGLFVGSGAQVALSSVTFSGDQARGGNGGSYSRSAPYYAGGGGLGGNGILPVCIKAGALADSVPARDLWISPHHAMYFENDGCGVLIEAKDLLNGVSIMQAERVEKVEYFHIELDTHDVIIADGALSETFLDDDSRCMFHNADEFRALYPEELAPVIAHYCAPRLEEGYELEAVRQRLRLRAGAMHAVRAAA